MNIDELYDARNTPNSERAKCAKNIVLVVPEEGFGVEDFLEQTGLDRHEVTVTWPKESVSLVEEVSAIAPEVAVQIGERLSRRYPFVDDGVLERVRNAAVDDFVCLHHHDEYSLKDGLGTVEQLVNLLKKQRRSFCAVTNHGSVGGWIKQSKACQEAGIKPIFGMEAYVSDYRGDDPEKRKMHRSANHLVLLARNETGFYNIIQIHNDAQLNGFYYSPRMDHAAAEKWGEGIIATSACLAGEVPRALMNDDYDKAKEIYDHYAKCFDEFYIELQIIEFKMQREANRRLIEFARTVGAPMIVSCDSHYLDPDHAETHDLLMYIRQNKTKLDAVDKDEDVWDFEVRNLFYRSGRQLDEVFTKGFVDKDKKECPPFEDEVFTREVFEEAMGNTLNVARKIEVVELDSEVKLPKLYPNSTEILRDKANAGFKALGLNKMPNKDEYVQRLRHEFGVITKLGWADYFLIMEKIVSMAKEEFYDEAGDFVIGYGRGSAAGCLVSWCLGLTDCDPLEHGLLFERFLDEGRPDPPDIDTDFHPAIRDRVKDRIVEIFGREKTCSIGTYNTYKTKAAIVAVAKALGYDPVEANIVTKEMESLKSFETDDGGDEIVDKMELDDLCNHYPKLKEYFEKYPDVKVHAEIIRNQVQHMGKHAGGVIISDMDLSGKIPVQQDGTKSIISSWAESGSAAELSEVGLVKYDILGLNNLPIIADCVRLIKENRGIEIRRKDIPLNDKKTIRMETKGDLRGIFQFESPATRPIVNAVGVESLNDVSAVTSLLRPGPKDMGMHMEYAERKNGKPYEVPEFLRWILKDTYGIMCIWEESCVSMVDGRNVPIKNVGIGDGVLSYGSGEISFDVCDGCGPTRRGDGWKVVLDNGYSVVLTGDHGVLTNSGMVEVDKLEEGDLVAIGRDCETDAREVFESDFGKGEHVAYLIGVMLGDGQVSHSVSISCGDEKRCDLLNKWIESNLKNIETRKYFHCRSWYLAVMSRKLLNMRGFGNRKTIWHHMLEGLGMKRTCYDKRIPEDLFRCGRELRLALLAGLFDSDGCFVESEDNCAYAFFTSVSKGLLDDVSHLLRGFGFVHYVRKNKVYVHGRKFAEEVSPYLVQKEIDASTWSSGEMVNWWPVDDLKRIVEDSGMSARAYVKENELNRGVLRRKACCPRTARKWGVEMGDIRYAKLVRVEKVEDALFYGIGVRRNHNLLANGIVVSNCYQEQMMQISQVLSGFDGPMANRLRKACGKKKMDLMKSVKKDFINGARERIEAKEITLQQVEEIWNLIVSFASYSFNRSHAVTYSMITTAELWLKHNYFLEYMTSLALNTKRGKKKHGSADILVDYLNHARKKGVDVLPPYINGRESAFHIEDNRAIRFGLEHVMNVASAARNISEIAREKPFESMEDFYKRCEYETEIKSGKNKGRMRTTRPNNKVVESLVYAGAFDCFGDRNKVLTEYSIAKLGIPCPTDEEIEEQRKKFLKGEECPRVNQKDADFSVIKGVKDVGENITAIAMDQPFESMADFYERCVYETEVKSGKNKGMVRETRPTKSLMEKLIYSGVFEEFGDVRQMFREYFLAKNKMEPVNMSEWEMESKEVEMIGMCLSREPVVKVYHDLIREREWVTIGAHENYRRPKVFGRIDAIESKNSRAGNPMFIVRMSDGLDNLDFFVFKGGMEYFRDSVKKGQLVAVPLDRFDDSMTRFLNDRGEISVIEE